MTSDRSESASGTGVASPTRPREKPASEGEYLEFQADMALDAIRRTARDLAEDLKVAGDPRSLIREHPVIALASGTGLGFLAAALLIPARGQSLQEKYGPLLEKLRREDRKRTGEERPGVIRRTVERKEMLLRAPSYGQIGKTLLSVLGRLLGLALAVGRRYALSGNGKGP